MLRGSVEQLNRLEDMMDGLTVMDETDHVDNDFLMGNAYLRQRIYGRE